MFRVIKKISFLPISVMFFWVWTLAFSPSRFLDDDRSLLDQTPSVTESFVQDGSCAISSKIRPGDVLLIRGDTWIDKIIRIITGSPYTHVAGVVNSDEAIEILPFKTVRFRKLSSYTGRTDVYAYSDLTDEQRKKIVEQVINKVGTKYDYKLIFWEASRYLLHWKWPYQAGNNCCLCSTLWAEAYRKAGVDLCPDILYPSPGDLGNSAILQKIESY